METLWKPSGGKVLIHMSIEKIWVKTGYSTRSHVDINFEEVLPEFGQIWPSLTEPFLEKLGLWINNLVKIDGKKDIYFYRNLLDEVKELQKEYYSYESSNGDLNIEVDLQIRSETQEKTPYLKIKVRMRAFVGRSFEIEICDVGIPSQCCIKKFQIKFPEPSSSSASSVQDILSKNNLEHDFTYAMSEISHDLDQMVSRLIEIANLSKDIEDNRGNVDYDLANAIFKMLYSNLKYLNNILYCGIVCLSNNAYRQYGCTNEQGYYDLLTLTNQSGESVLIPYDLVDEVNVRDIETHEFRENLSTGKDYCGECYNDLFVEAMTLCGLLSLEMYQN